MLQEKVLDELDSTNELIRNRWGAVAYRGHKGRDFLLDFTDYLIYYTRKEVTYELLTCEYNFL